jgi:hypothetical protein
MLEHTFAADADERVVIGVPGFCGSLQNYMVARSGQLKALSALMVNAAEFMDEMDEALRSDLLWLSQMLASEIADAIGQRCALEGRETSSHARESHFTEELTGQVLRMVAQGDKGVDHG